MKKKSLATLLSGFLTVCLTGVGFAAWVITGNGEAEFTGGNVDVETVSDRRVDIQLLSSDELTAYDTANPDKKSDFNIIFGHEANTSVTNPWFVAENPVNQDLEALIPIKIKNHEYATISLEYGATLTALTGTGTDATTDDYIKINDFVYTAPTSKDDKGYGIATIKLSFGWGAKFAVDGIPKNPYTYYNSKSMTDDLVKEALDLFGETGTISSLTSFSVTIKGTYTA